MVNINKAVIPIIKKYKYRYTFIILLLFATSVVEIIPVMLIKKVADQTNYTQDFFLSISLIFLLIGVLSYAFNVLRTYLYVDVSIMINTDSMKNLLHKITNTDWTSIKKMKIGDTISTVENDSQTVSSMVSFIIVSVMSNIFDIIMALAALYYLNLSFLAISILIVPILLFVLKKIQNVLKNAIRKRREYEVDMKNAKIDILSGLAVLKLNNLHRYGDKTFSDAANKVVASVGKHRLFEAFTTNVSMIAGYFLFAVIFMYGGYLHLHQEVTIGVLIASYTCVFKLYSPIQNLFMNSINLNDINIAYERISRYLDLPKEDAANQQVKQNFSISNIKCVDINLSLDDKKILTNLNLSFDSAGIYGIVGESGTGKTSLINIFYKFYQEYSGNILINDNINLKDVCCYDIRNKLASVLQEPFLFSTTIMENLLIASKKGTDEDFVINFCKLYKINDFIEKLPKGYQTVVGQGGHDLSRGEKQRLSLIRALLRDPDVLILDEATNSLDPANERLFYEILLEISQSKIVIMVSHELWKLKDCKKLYILKEGSVVESGLHSELMEKKGEYSRLQSFIN